MSKPRPRLTLDRVQELFEYRDGSLINRVRRGPFSFAGRPAGSINGNGYLQTWVDGHSFRIHTLVWFLHRQEWPVEVDHINGIRTDNRIENRREVTRRENMRNKRVSVANSSGITGVGWSSAKQKWRACIKVDGKFIHLGYFEEKRAAIAAREEANRKYGFHENHGKAFA